MVKTYNSSRGIKMFCSRGGRQVGRCPYIINELRNKTWPVGTIDAWAQPEPHEKINCESRCKYALHTGIDYDTGNTFFSFFFDDLNRPRCNISSEWSHWQSTIPQICMSNLLWFCTR